MTRLLAALLVIVLSIPTTAYGLDGLTTEQEIQQLYIAYLGRPADTAGMQYWAGEVDANLITLDQIRVNIVNEQPEYLENYGQLSNSELAARVYQNLFNRDPDEAGLAYWINQLETGAVPQDSLIIAYVNGAAEPDQQVLRNKLFVAECFTSGEGGYSEQVVQELLTQVTSDPLLESCPATSSTTASLSGSVSFAANTQFDSDTNDPLTSFTDNSTIANAQAIDNLVTIQGFATAITTLNANDRFAQSVDPDDYFRVELQQGQLIQMQVVDYDQFQVSGAYEGDLDLYLYDSQGGLVASSSSSSEFEQLQVPATGQYYINVNAYSGASKYVLRLLASTQSQSFANSRMDDFVPNQAIVKLSPTTLPLAIASANSTVEFMHTDTGRATLASFRDTMQLYAASMSLSPAEQELAVLNPASYEKVQTLRKIKALSLTPGVEYAEPNYIRKTFAIPNDEFYYLQWHYPAMNLPQAWDITTGSSNVIVAVIDTGVVLDHPDFAGQLVQGYDFISHADISNDGGGIDNNPDDPGDGTSVGSSSWHGTHVAGTVAAASNNGYGVAGVAWGAKVMPIRVLGVGGGTTYDIMQGVRYAAGLSNDSGTVPSQRADILNLSLGGFESSTAEVELFQEVYNAGVITIAAAGNENTSQLSYPASYDGVVSVSALDFQGNRAPYSNFGTTVDIAAPGGDTDVDLNGDGNSDGIISTFSDDSSGERKPIFKGIDGTSMAAPHVAGLAALMKSVYPALDAASFDSLLQNGSLTNDTGTPGRDDIYGYGTADALKAVQAAQSLAAGSETPELPASIVASPSAISLGTSSSTTLTLSNQGAGQPTVSSINSNASWLTATAQTVDSAGLGSYLLTIDRSALNNGFYLAELVFNFNGASSITVRVSMTVGQLSTSGSLAELYFLLYDPTTDGVIQQVQGTSDGNGNISYAFSSVPNGNYILYAGTDIDNDSYICDAGEGCGVYPNLGDFVSLEINGVDLSGIDFVADIVAGFNSISPNTVGNTDDKRTGIQRLTITKQLGK